MTVSITGKKRCGCGQYKDTHDNGTLVRHTTPSGDKRVRCQFSGKFPPAVAKMRKETNDRDFRANRPLTYATEQIPSKPTKLRGGHRDRKRIAALKSRYRRNAAGGYGAR